MATGRTGAFHALRSRDFRLIAIGNMVSQLGTWVQYVALGWVARLLTSSPLLISLVFAAQWAPYLVLSPLTGVIADRLDRRKIVLWGNLAMVAPAAALGVLFATHRLNLVSLVVLVVLGGAAQSFTQPAATAFIPALVGPDHLHSAVALNAGLSSSTRVIGPSIGGFIISTWGVNWAFQANAVSFFAVAFACLAVKARPAAHPHANSPMEGLRLGIDYVRANPAALRVIVFMASVTFLMMQAGLMSVMARDVLHGDAGTYGLISSGPGFGFVAASFLTANLRDDGRRTLALLVCGLSTGLSLLVIGLSRSVALTVAGMALFGASNMTISTVSSTLLLATSTDDYRGRVMGLFGMVSTGMFTVNSLIGGTIASVVGAPATITACGIGIIAVTSLFATNGTRRLILRELQRR